MNQLAVVHQGRGIDCFALDAHTFRIRLRCAAGDFDRVELCYALNKYEWHIGQQRTPMQRWGSDGITDYYTYDLQGEETRIAYIFILHRGKRKWYFSEEGVSKDYDFSKGYYTFFQYPYVHDCDIHHTISWADRAVIYQIFPERFAIGIPGKEYITAAWDKKPTPKDYYGGDLPGIEQHLDYLTDLGVNCIYMTPVNPAKSNHKYNIMDYDDVDRDFGGKEALISLVHTAHQRGMKVMLDGVYNHCSWETPMFQDVIKKGKESPYWDWFFVDGENVDLKHPNYLMFAACPDMPKLNTGCPAVIEYFCGLAAKWTREYGIDGWRLDVMDEISYEFLRAFRKAVKAVNPDAVILGEAWHEPAVWLRGDQLDSVMNYGLTKALMDYLVERKLDAAGMASRLMRLYMRTTSMSARMMLNLMGSHDTHRFLTLLNGDKARLKLAFAIMFFYVGIPCIYYGDEVGMEGGYDPGCRGGFPWDSTKWDHELRNAVQQLCLLKTSGKLSGDEIQIQSMGDALVISRKHSQLIVNGTDQPIELEIKGITHHLDACTYVVNSFEQRKESIP